jgi:hypothetical protein
MQLNIEFHSCCVQLTCLTLGFIQDFFGQKLNIARYFGAENIVSFEVLCNYSVNIGIYKLFV